MEIQPYVGVTGPSTLQEVRSLCEAFKDARYSMNSGHIPMTGVLVSLKTLNGTPVENRRYPAFAQVPEMLDVASRSTLAMIHYNSREIETLAGQVSKIFSNVYEQNFCKAIQVNIPWPDPEQIAQIKREMPDLQIVLQLSEKAMSGFDSHIVAKKTGSYGSSIDYVLIDPSGGRGKEFDFNSAAELFEALSEHCPSVTVGFAGGFNGDNVARRVNQLCERLRDEHFCIDAEGGLRDKLSENYGDDLLNIEKVNHYLSKASRVLP